MRTVLSSLIAVVSAVVALAGGAGAAAQSAGLVAACSYLVFIVDTNGVPSVASFVSVGP
jgi:hypothetical protein